MDASRDKSEYLDAIWINTLRQLAPGAAARPIIENAWKLGNGESCLSYAEARDFSNRYLPEGTGREALAKATGLDERLLEPSLASLEAFLGKTEQAAEVVCRLDTLQKKDETAQSRDFAWANLAGKLQGPAKTLVNYAADLGYPDAGYSLASAASFVKSYLLGELTAKGISKYSGISVSGVENGINSIKESVLLASEMAGKRAILG
ncbi:MAG: hypothetical protein V1820_01940 [archaeon]